MLLMLQNFAHFWRHYSLLKFLGDYSTFLGVQFFLNLTIVLHVCIKFLIPLPKKKKIAGIRLELWDFITFTVYTHNVWN